MNTGRDKVQAYIHAGSRTGEWFWYTHSYLDAAKILALANGESSDGQKHLIIPLIFNLRHALELLLKFLAYGTGTLDKINHHDIPTIFAGVAESLEGIDEQSLSFAAEGLGVEPELIAKYLRIMSEKVQQATNKYYSYGFLTDDQVPIDDPKNILFRYPSTTLEKGAFDPYELKKRVLAADILKDIELLSNFAWSVYLMFGKNQDGLHVLDGLEGKDAATDKPI
jgi:hypothetical protein